MGWGREIFLYVKAIANSLGGIQSISLHGWIKKESALRQNLSIVPPSQKRKCGFSCLEVVLTSVTRPFVPVCGAREWGSQTVAFAADQPRAAQCAPRDDVKLALVPRALPRAWLHSEKGATKRSAGSNGAVKTGAICGRGKLRLGGTWETLWKKIVVTNTHWTMSPWEEEQANGAEVVCPWLLCSTDDTWMYSPEKNVEAQVQTWNWYWYQNKVNNTKSFTQKCNKLKKCLKQWESVYKRR